VKQINNAKLTQIGSVSNRGYVEGRGDEGNVRAVVGIDRKVRTSPHLAPEPRIGRTLALKWPYLGHFRGGGWTSCPATSAVRELGIDRTEHRATGEFIDYIGTTIRKSDCELFQALNEVGGRSGRTAKSLGNLSL
jgi:hypothetical protein